MPQGGGRPGENKKTIPHTKRRKKKQLATGEQKTRSAGKRLQFVACHRGTEGQERRKMHYPARSAGKKKTCRRRPEGQERRQNDALREAQGKKYIYDGPRMEEKPLHRTKRKEKYGQPLNEL